MYAEAHSYIAAYRTAKLQELNNTERAQWFTSGSASMSALMTKFSTDTDNNEWEKIYLSNAPDKLKLRAQRFKVVFTASARQDVREQFVVGGDTTQLAPRTACDYLRQAYASVGAAGYACERILRNITTLSKGVSK